MKFAAIDIGSNAVRLLFARVFEDGKSPFFKKDSLFRVPLRLGDDVFTHRKISDEKASSLVEAMIAFKHLIQSYQPIDYLACATSAMREATNAKDVVSQIKKQAMIEVEIIDGQKEAEIIYSNHIAETPGRKKAFLYIDVGGGSTEITFVKNGRIKDSESFKLGTVRMLEHRDSGSEWDNLRKWLKKRSLNNGKVMGIGSGGNINKISDLSLKKEGKPLTYKEIKKMYKHLKSYSLQERMKILKLKPDRADVIIPASKIFLSVLQWAEIEKIYVPQIGLSDGIIHVLYEKYRHFSWQD